MEVSSSTKSTWKEKKLLLALNFLSPFEPVEIDKMKKLMKGPVQWSQKTQPTKQKKHQEKKN